MTKIAERIKERRLHLGLSQLALAYKIGKSLTQVIRYEKGENDPTGEVLIALGQTLQVSVDYLLGLVDEPEGRIMESDLSPEEQELVREWRAGRGRKLLEEGKEEKSGGDQSQRTGATNKVPKPA